MELFETSLKDVEIVHDFFVGVPDLSSKGIRVHIRANSRNEYEEVCIGCWRFLAFGCHRR